MKRKVSTETEESGQSMKKVHPFFAVNKNNSSVRWITSTESLLIAKSNLKTLEKSKFAAFDLDGTLITTKSGHVFPKNEHDWVWWNAKVPKKLEALNQEGYGIVVFSNQNGLNSDKKIKSFQIKIDAILSQIDSPVLFLAALKKDKFRKPMTGMWDWLVEENSIEIEKSASFFIGDAAGRQNGWKPKYKKDHSTADRKFADNVGIRFQTPEEFFLEESEASFEWGGFNAKEHIKRALPLYTPDVASISDKNNKKSEVIVCVGYPASGKSSFVKRHLLPKNYVHINQDTLKSKEKCVAACKHALANNQSVVIDNTNPEAATRKLYIQLAKQANVPVRCFYFGSDGELAQHNNYYRALHKPEEKRELLSSVAFRMFKSKMQEPTESEGFDEIKRINFVFEGSDADKEQWQKWWC